MPYAARTRCTHPGCGALAVNRGRCEQHQPKPWARASQHTRHLNRTLWEHARVARLTYDDGRCVYCGAPATEVHHVVAVADGGDLYGHDNLASVCPSCHATLTRLQDDRRRGVTRYGGDDAATRAARNPI